MFDRTPRPPAIDARRTRRRYAYALSALLVLTALPMPRIAGARAAVGSGAQRSLSAQSVVAAFHRQGLTLDHVRRQPVASDVSPDGPPTTEREAWSFTIRNAAHSDGLILIFANTQRLDVKESWYRRVGARILVQRNVIVWLDRALAPAIVARCGVALARMA